MVFFDLARQHQADLVGVEEILVELVVQELLVRDIMEQVAQVEAQKYLAAAAVLVGQVRMQLMAAGAMDDLDKACRINALRSAQSLADSSVLITDRLRQGRLEIETAYYDLDTAEIDWLGAVKPTALN